MLKVSLESGKIVEVEFRLKVGGVRRRSLVLRTMNDAASDPYVRESLGCREPRF